MDDDCVFCRIIAGQSPASVVREDALTLAFMDMRQFHPGHVLVVPKVHVADVRDLDDETGAAMMSALIDVTRATSAAFPSPGMSVWHSIGEAGGQEVFHLHFHVHPREESDRVMEIYPSQPEIPGRDVLEQLAAAIRPHLEQGG